MTYEGLRDWLGRECTSLVSFRGNKWEFAGLDVAGLEGFAVDIGKISGESKNLQKISDLIAALDNIQFADCQRRKKWHERLKKEEDATIRLEITRRLLENEDKSYQTILEITRLLKQTKSAVEGTDTTRESNILEAQLDNVIAHV
jgi:hypothetical protein